MQDSIVIFVLALMLLGPKRLPQLARQLGKLMAEFRKASNDFRMQMEDELRIEDQKEHQKKVDALAPPPSTVANADTAIEDAPHPHMLETTPEALSATAARLQPIAESGELKMMPPSTGLPLESSARGTSAADTAPATAEHSIAAEHLTAPSAGMSSEEPVHDAVLLEPPPDRGRPAMVGEGIEATHA